MNLNIVIKNLIKQIKNIFSSRATIQENKNINKKQSNWNVKLEKEIQKNCINNKQKTTTNEKINIKFSRIEEYICFLKNQIENKICLANIHLEFWKKFYVYNISKFTNARISEFEKIFYSVMEQVETYFNENNISISHRWFLQTGSEKYRIGNDISFLLRYSENLLRYKNDNKRLLSYDKFVDIDFLKNYLDNKFVNLINAKQNEILLNIPNTLFQLDVENFDVIDYKLEDYIEEKNFDNDLKNRKHDKEILDLKKIEILNYDEFDKLIDDIDDFEL